MAERPENDVLEFTELSETADVQTTIGDTVEALRHSAEFFIHFFLGEELEFPVPEFHKDAWTYLTYPEVPRIAIALPRGHAKTTLAKLGAVWHYLFTEVRFIVYVSNTFSIAAEACQDIVNYMQCQNFMTVFGPVAFDVEQKAHGFYKFRMSYIDAAGLTREKYCILRALGAGQQIRGMNIDNTRPQLAIVDDLESDENTDGPTLIKKLHKWFFGAFYKALAHRNKIIFLGNMLSSKSLLYLFCEKSEQWHSIRFGCLKTNGEPLWADIWSLEKIKADFLEYQLVGLIGSWFAEMMNMPIADGNLLINSDEIYYVPPLVPGEQDAAFITVDTAISQESWADDSAVVCHAIKDGLPRVVETAFGKISPDRLFFIILDMCFRWNTRTVGMAEAAIDQTFKFLFSVLMTVHQQHFEILGLPHTNKSKYSHLSAWCSLIRKKQWGLENGDYAITEQLLMYDPAKKNNTDDLIDACAMGVTMKDMYLPFIMDQHMHEANTMAVQHMNMSI